MRFSSGWPSNNLPTLVLCLILFLGFLNLHHSFHHNFLWIFLLSFLAGSKIDSGTIKHFVKVLYFISNLTKNLMICWCSKISWMSGRGMMVCQLPINLIALYPYWVAWWNCYSVSPVFRRVSGQGVTLHWWAIQVAVVVWETYPHPRHSNLCWTGWIKKIGVEGLSSQKKSFILPLDLLSL